MAVEPIRPWWCVVEPVRESGMLLNRSSETKPPGMDAANGLPSPGYASVNIQDQPCFFNAQPEFQILVMCLILSPSKFIEYT